MMSVSALTDVVRAAPMPLYVKEQILDQVLGHHDDLTRPGDLLRQGNPLPLTRTPLAVRVAQAGRDGAFRRDGVEENGDERFLYCKRGETAYVVLVRDGVPVNCGCVDFWRKSARQPDYCCKHMDLWTRTEAGVTDEDLAADALIAECARLAGAFEAAWFAWRRGTGTSEACDKAGRELDAARTLARGSYADAVGPNGDDWGCQNGDGLNCSDKQGIGDKEAA